MCDLKIALNHIAISILFQYIVQPDFAGVKREVDTYLDMTSIMSVFMCHFVLYKSVVFIKSVCVSLGWCSPRSIGLEPVSGGRGWNGSAGGKGIRVRIRLALR